MENTKPCVELLESLDICPRCILRFLGEKNYVSYTSKEQVRKKLTKFVGSAEISIKDVTEVHEITVSENGSPSPKRHLPSLCSICLGILQDGCDSMADKVEAVVKNSGFQFASFTFQVSLPVTTDLKQQLMYFYVKESLGTAYDIAQENIPSIKEVWKWVVGSKFGKSVEAEFCPDSNFQISITMSHPDLVQECTVLLKTIPEAFPKRRKKKVEFKDIFTRTAVSNAMDLLSEKLKSLYSLPPLSPSKPCVYEDIVCSHSPLYLAGRYNKYSRELSQTPWIVDGERRMESSVQEHITNCVQQWILCDKIVFSASGREDVDVKMLGNGRPFILEIINPRCSKWSAEQMKSIENDINSTTKDIFVRDLQVISKADIQNLKEGEEYKRKTYSALCVIKKELTIKDVEKLKSVVDLTLKQMTPIRVLHRRPLATRDKIIHRIDGDILGPHELKISIETQAGTYVKEFVHGDFGRTVPNLGTLLDTEADILELDVESIHLDWPPEIKS